MHFAVSIPGWNSLDSVRRAHSDLEAAALVFFALLVFFDVLAHFSDDKQKERLFEKIGLWCFAIAIFAEIVAYPYGQRNDWLSAQVIGSLDVKAQSALGKAEDAVIRADEAEEKSGNALTRAQNAEKSLGKAENKASQAQAASSNAMSLARGARQEADSFEADIESAKKAAGEAEAKLADRTLTDEQVLSIGTKLKAFSGQPYTVTAYWQSKESLGIANRIQIALQTVAGWSYSDEGSKGMMLGGVVGVVVWTHPDADEKTIRAANSLIEALNAEGIEAAPHQENAKSPKSNNIGVDVGAKR